MHSCINSKLNYELQPNFNFHNSNIKYRSNATDSFILLFSTLKSKYKTEMSNLRQRMKANGRLFILVGDGAAICIFITSATHAFWKRKFADTTYSSRTFATASCTIRFSLIRLAEYNHSLLFKMFEILEAYHQCLQNHQRRTGLEFG